MSDTLEVSDTYNVFTFYQSKTYSILRSLTAKFSADFPASTHPVTSLRVGNRNATGRTKRRIAAVPTDVKRLSVVAGKRAAVLHGVADFHTGRYAVENQPADFILQYLH